MSDTNSRVWAVPLALAAMGLLGLTSSGAFLLRVFFGMWLHELGHALAAWFCGVLALPLPWLTWSGDARSPLFILLLLGGLAALGHRWRKEVWLAIPLVLLGVVIPFRHATTFITFFGDGGALVLGTALMLAAMLLPDDMALTRGGLRWGYLVIGAGAVMDVFHTWFAAWRDVAELPLGRTESSGLSDASRLIDLSGWSEPNLVRSYLGLFALCLAVLAGFAVRQLQRR